MYRFVKRKEDKKYTGYQYTYDGMYPPRVKKMDKKRRQRDGRTYLKRDTEETYRREWINMEK